jgi:hypothetical protein
LEGSRTLWCHEKDYNTGIPDIGIQLALYLKYLENDSEFYYYWALRSSQDTKFKSIILLIENNLMLPANGQL